MNQPKKNEKLIPEKTPQTTEDKAVKKQKFTFKDHMDEGINDLESQYKTNDKNLSNKLEGKEYLETNEGVKISSNLTPKTPGSEENPLIDNTNYNPQLTKKTISDNKSNKEKFIALDFNQQKIRKGFIQKTFTIVALNLPFFQFF